MLTTERGFKDSGDWGASESIGFLLIFTIIIAGIGLVTLYGYPMLTEQQVSADEKIMEKNMIVLQNDFKSLAYKTVPYKETSLKIGSGPLTVYGSDTGSSSMLDIYNGTAYYPTFYPGELRYESISAKTDIALENGAVILRPRIESGSTMLAEPRWFYDEVTNTLVINLIKVTSDSVLAKEGIGTVQMRLDDANTNYLYSPSSSVVITYTPKGPDYSVAWDNFMKKNFASVLPRTSGTPGQNEALTYTSSIPMDLVIKQYEIKIESI